MGGKLTFNGGIHPYDGKDLSKDKPIRDILPKGDLVYPLSQHIGAPAKPVVKKGDHVLTGQLIARGGRFCFRTGLCNSVRNGQGNRAAPDSCRRQCDVCRDRK